jgi:hypothetical protein
MEKIPSPESGKSPWHIYPPGWKDSQWLVPYQGENALLRHGHTSPDDHSLCGPVLFCCAKSQQLYLETFPEGETMEATWELTEADHIATWLDSGVGVLYFVFCDPVRPKGLLTGGLSGDEAQLVLYKKTPIEAYAGRASRLR